ncbi:MAG: guanylate kinase [Bacteroidetes bacterium]|nr:MAG: guanylate kinase [Bacteroidota bacterium]TAG94706.1 MAG: guanylate kinase [Bacteroidota bacterium]
MLENIDFKGKIIIFSAPSGAGKTTLVRHILSILAQNLGFSVSVCTRQKRSHEVEGQDYYFLDIDLFKEKIKNDEFVEWQEVYENSFYGTLKTEIARIWASKKHVIFDVDVKGALNLKEFFGENAISIFVLPPSLEELEKRLRERKTETEESLKKRIDKFQYEFTFQNQFDKVIINNDLKKAMQEAEILVKNFIGK